MTDFLNKISLYEQFSYLVVGGLFYVFFDYDLAYFDIDLSKITENAFGIAIAVYFMGHVAQAIANQILKEKKGTFDEKENSLLQEIKQKFKLGDSSNGAAFSVCYLWALEVDKTGHVGIMNANYGSYRGWYIVLGLQFIFYAIVISFEALDCEYKASNFIGFIVTAILGFLMFKRARRFYKYISDKVFQTFIIHKNDIPD